MLLDSCKLQGSHQNFSHFLQHHFLQELGQHGNIVQLPVVAYIRLGLWWHQDLGSTHKCLYSFNFNTVIYINYFRMSRFKMKKVGFGLQS